MDRPEPRAHQPLVTEVAFGKGTAEAMLLRTEISVFGKRLKVSKDNPYSFSQCVEVNCFACLYKYLKWINNHCKIFLGPSINIFRIFFTFSVREGTSCIQETDPADVFTEFQR